MKIYTKTGDKGYTSLVSGRRVRKDDLRVEAYGTVDELHSFMGLLCRYIQDEKLRLFLQQQQHLLISIGGVLADDRQEIESPNLNQSIADIETWIDALSDKLPPLKHFIIVGNKEGVAEAHICRTVTRRAERRIINAAVEQESLLQYFNRLSDFFFIIARTLEI